MDAAVDDATDMVVDATAATLEVVADVVEGSVDLMAPTRSGRRQRGVFLLMLVVVAVVVAVLMKRRGGGDD